MQMEIEEFCEFCDAMIKSINKEKIRSEYLALMPWMKAGFLNDMSYREYEDLRTGANIDTRSEAEILADVAQVRKELE